MGKIEDLEALLGGDEEGGGEREDFSELATKRSLSELECLAWGVAEQCISIRSPVRLDLQRCEIAIKMAETAAKLRLTSAIDSGGEDLKTEDAARQLFRQIVANGG